MLTYVVVRLLHVPANAAVVTERPGAGQDLLIRELGHLLACTPEVSAQLSVGHRNEAKSTNPF